MKRKLIVLAALICLVAVSVVYAQTRLRSRGAQVGITSSGGVAITPFTGQSTAVTGAMSISGLLTASAGVSVSGRNVAYATKTALTAGATVAIDSTLGNFFTLTPAQDEAINATTVGVQGQVLIIKILTSGTTSRTLTFGTNFLSTGTLATGTGTAKTFMIAFLSDGANYIELFRTAAQ